MWDKVKLTRPSFRDLFWLFAQVLKASPFIAAVWIILVLINAGAGAAQLLVLRETVNTLVDADLMSSAVPWLAALCLLFLVEQAISTFLPLLREQLRIRAGFTLQRDALQKTGKLPLEAFDDEESHNLINRVVTGGDSSVVQLMQNGLNFIEYTPVLLTSAVVLGLISIWIPLIIIGGAILLRVFEIRMGARMRHFEVENTRNKRLADYYVQLLTERRSAAEIRLWGIGETLLQRWRTILSQYLRERLGIDFQNASQGIFQVFIFVAIIAGALLVTLLSQGRIEAGLAALVLEALRNITAGMNSMQYFVIGFVQHAGYGEDLRRLLEEEEEGGAPETQTPYPHPMREGIRLHSVAYRYPGADTNALSDVDVHIRPGEILAIVGENGAGKTTLAHILAGLRSPTSGHVTIDGINTDTISSEDLRRACTVVFQQPARYPTTLHENLILDNRDEVTSPLHASDAHVAEILTQVGLQSERFPLNTFLGPEFGGVDFSGGEWQRVAIARSLIKEDSEFVIFDEPTAALDPLAELEIFQQFVELVDGKTALLIAHRLGPTRLADRVVVLDNGHVVEIGNPTELLQRDGKYTEMFAAQSEWYQ
ncbi:ABC transporter ATP-binding protein [Candidatus Poribacteria bacterium]|nr:ABC transporter ATP-binding protein [Candidatus Poribacteria bacterium]